MTKFNDNIHLSEAEDRVKTLPTPSVIPGARSMVFRLNSSRGQTARPVSVTSHCADSSLAFFKEVGSSFRFTPALVRLHSHA